MLLTHVPFILISRRWLLPLCLCLLCHTAAAEITENTVTSDKGILHLVHPEDAPKGLVLFLPGSQGWDAAAVATAREVADQGHLVAGIDWRTLAANRPVTHWWQLSATVSRLRQWLTAWWSDQETAPASCWDLSADLADVTQWLKAHETLPQDTLPILLGESDGAALVYAALLQSPSGSFHAAVSRGFCPTWPTAAPPACPQAGLGVALVQDQQLRPAAQVPSAWFLFESNDQPACSASQSAEFIKQMANARMTITAPPDAMPATTTDEDEDVLSPLASLFEWLDPRIPDQVSVVSAQTETAGLPLIEVPAPQPDATTFAIMLSGDGGWAELDRTVSAHLAAQGISTVGWDSLSYFWSARSPAEAGADLARVIRHYQRIWHKDRVILIGFSFGAEVLPFMANRLPDDLRSQVELVALLSVGRTALFQFHLTDWLDTGRGSDALPELPQVQALNWTRRLCIYGEEDDQSLCPDLVGSGVDVRKLPGDHHFGEDYAGVAELILKARPGTQEGSQASPLIQSPTVLPLDVHADNQKR